MRLWVTYRAIGDAEAPSSTVVIEAADYAAAYAQARARAATPAGSQILFVSQWPTGAHR